MPNWCKGTLKLRGESKDISNFLRECIKPSGDEPSLKIEIKFQEDDDWFTITSNLNWFYVKGTFRGFITDKEIEYYKRDKVLVLHYAQAWGVDSSELATISKEYNLDIKLYAYEKGMEFNQDIEIHKGEMIKDETVNFDDYSWECRHPEIGG